VRARRETLLRHPRPRRGAPLATRERLVEAAARVFNRDGYHATDSNRLARAAGYAPGTFYKHFADKREIFVAVYDAWVAAEWTAVEQVLSRPGSADALAARIVERVIAFHRRWRTLRASLQVLVRTEPTVRAAYRRQRARQLRMLAALRARAHTRAHSREADLLLLYTLERTCDGIADGEVRALGGSIETAARLLRRTVRAYLDDDVATDRSGAGTAAPRRGTPRAGRP
jgi:AcrR family transcriptional regulator